MDLQICQIWKINFFVELEPIEVLDPVVHIHTLFEIVSL
jgi:hypothetical protein